MPISAGGWFEEPEFRYCTTFRKLCQNLFLERTQYTQQYICTLGANCMNACEETQGVDKPQMNPRFKEHTLFKP